MSDYNPPIRDMQFALRELAGLEHILSLDAFSSVDLPTAFEVVEQAGLFGSEVLAPLNVTGDREGVGIENGEVRIASGFGEAYRQFVENGWQSLAAPAAFGGMGLPEAVSTAAYEIWQSANMSFSLCPMLTSGAISALEIHGTEALKETYLPKLVSGEWCGTMVLTEPQAGSDLAAITTKAVPEGDHYRITGTKIYITWGDHSMAENVIHLVLARLQDAPEGIRGISMFLIPKFLVNEDGSIGERNDVYATSVEHKLGIHASPTCVMNFGDTEGAIGYLVGEENRGMANMFTMMNRARLEVGVQGLAISERAYQLARSYALERVQGSAPGHKGRVTIARHADVRRMLMLMKSQTEAMRAAAYATGALLDLVSHSPDEEERERADARLALLTPVVKGWMSEVAQEIASVGIQIHGGMGYVEETGAAQHFRDARILTIYEGTTGIQANDFLGRKILGDEGRALAALVADMRATASEIAGKAELGTLARSLDEAIDELEQAGTSVLRTAPANPDAPGAAAVNLLMLTGTVLGGWQMARAAQAAGRDDGSGDASFRNAKIATAIFYGAHVLPRSSAYARAATADPAVVMGLADEQL